MNEAVMGNDARELMEYHHLMKKITVKYGVNHQKKIGRLTQGMPGTVERTNSTFFISKNKVPDFRFQDVTNDKL